MYGTDISKAVYALHLKRMYAYILSVCTFRVRTCALWVSHPPSSKVSVCIHSKHMPWLISKYVPWLMCHDSFMTHLKVCRGSLMYRDTDGGRTRDSLFRTQPARLWWGWVTSHIQRYMRQSWNIFRDESWHIFRGAHIQRWGWVTSHM